MRFGALGCVVWLVLGNACIGRSLLDDGAGEGGPTACERPQLEACRALSEGPPASPVSAAALAFGPSQRACMLSAPARSPTDRGQGSQHSLTCSSHDLVPKHGGLTVLADWTFQDAALRVHGEGGAAVELVRPRGQGLLLETFGDVSVTITGGWLEHVRVVLDQDAVDAVLTLDESTVKRISVHGPEQGELRARDAALQEAQIELGRVTLEQTNVEQASFMVRDLLAVDSTMDSSHVTTQVGALYATELIESALLACDEFLISHGNVSGGYLQGCTSAPLRLEGTRIAPTDSRPTAEVPMVGPIYAIDTEVRGAVIGGLTGAHGVSFSGATLRSSVMCDPKVVNAERSRFSCTVCDPEAEFDVCSMAPSELSFFDSDCPPLFEITCRSPSPI